MYFPSFGMFQAGDRVRHVGRQEDGAVLPFDTAGVVKVEFDDPTPRGNRSIGEYDETWFRIHPHLLQFVSRPTEPK
jgi:hypothetical protein